MARFSEQHGGINTELLFSEVCKNISLLGFTEE
jgi:hypothetical protein